MQIQRELIYLEYTIWAEARLSAYSRSPRCTVAIVNRREEDHAKPPERYALHNQTSRDPELSGCQSGQAIFLHDLTSRTSLPTPPQAPFAQHTDSSPQHCTSPVKLSLKAARFAVQCPAFHHTSSPSMLITSRGNPHGRQISVTAFHNLASPCCLTSKAHFTCRCQQSRPASGRRAVSPCPPIKISSFSH